MEQRHGDNLPFDAISVWNLDNPNGRREEGRGAARARASLAAIAVLGGFSARVGCCAACAPAHRKTCTISFGSLERQAEQN